MNYKYQDLLITQLLWAVGEVQEQWELIHELTVALNSSDKAKALFDYTIKLCQETYLPNTETTLQILKVAKKDILAGAKYEDIILLINGLFEGNLNDLYKKLYVWSEFGSQITFRNSQMQVRINSYGGVPDTQDMLKVQLMKLQAKYFKS